MGNSAHCQTVRPKYELRRDHRPAQFPQRPRQSHHPGSRLGGDLGGRPRAGGECERGCDAAPPGLQPKPARSNDDGRPWRSLLASRSTSRAPTIPTSTSTTTAMSPSAARSDVYAIASRRQPVADLAPFLTMTTRRTGTIVTYGTTTYQGHPAFCVERDGVLTQPPRGQAEQVRVDLASRPDRAAGDSDIVLTRPDRWETGRRQRRQQWLEGIPRGSDSASPAEAPRSCPAPAPTAPLSTAVRRRSFRGLRTAASGDVRVPGDRRSGGGRARPARLGQQPQRSAGRRLGTGLHGQRRGPLLRTTQTDGQGRYSFTRLAEGIWNVPPIRPPAIGSAARQSRGGPDQGSAPVDPRHRDDHIHPAADGTVVGGSGMLRKRAARIGWTSRPR